MAPWKKQLGKGEPMKILLKLPLKNHCSVTIGLMQLSLQAVEEVSSCSESHHGYNSRRHDFWSMVLAGLLPFKTQHFGCWRASTTPTSEAWGGSGSWKQGWGCWSPPAPHLRNLNPALVSVRGMKCHSLGVLYTSYTFIFFLEIFIIFIAVNLTNWGCEKAGAASFSSPALRVRVVITHTVSFVFPT